MTEFEEMTFTEQRQVIRANITPADAMELLGLSTPQRGDTGHVSCPFHVDDTPSMMLYEDSIHCFSCGFDGDVIWLCTQATGCTPGKAVRYLARLVDDLEARPVARREKPVLDLQDKLPAPQPWGTWHYDYAMSKWGLPLQPLEAWDVRPMPNGFAIPHWHDGRVTAIKYRDFDGKKWGETGSTFLGLYRLEPTPTDVIICEGESDAWAAFSHLGWEHGIEALPSGAQTWRRSWVENWSREARIWLAFDNDDAGRKAYLDISTDLLKAGFLDVRKLDHPEQDLADSLKSGWRP